jgi:DNA polymerase III subunit gamma/tau
VGDIARLLRLIVDRENARAGDEGARIDIQDAALLEIARHSQGGFRDAIGTLDKLITYAEGAIRPADVLNALGITSADLLFEITDIVAERQTAEALQLVQRLANEGTDYSQFIRDLLRHLRQLFLLQHLEASAEDEAALRALGQTVELDEQLLGRLLPQAHQLHQREVVHFIETLGRAQGEIRDGLDPRLQLELALVKVARPQVDHSLAALEERLRRLETSTPGASTPAAPPSAAPELARQEVRSGAPPIPDAAAHATSPAPQPSAVAPDPGVAETPQLEDAQAADVPGDAPELTLERVKRAWDLVLQRLQSSSPPLYALLRDARPAVLDGDLLKVAIHSSVALTRARMPGNAEILAAALEATLGMVLTATFVPGETPAVAPQPQTPEAPADLDFTALIKQAGELLDAEPLPDDS